MRQTHDENNSHTQRMVIFLRSQVFWLEIKIESSFLNSVLCLLKRLQVPGYMGVKSHNRIIHTSTPKKSPSKYSCWLIYLPLLNLPTNVSSVTYWFSIRVSFASTEPPNKRLQCHLLVLYQDLLWTLAQPPCSHHVPWIMMHRQAARVQGHWANGANGFVHPSSAVSICAGEREGREEGLFLSHLCASSGPSLRCAFFFFLLEGVTHAYPKARLYA